jgi:sulfoxide reductase catalytic subunit YedY
MEDSMHVIRKKGWEIPESRVTPESVYLNRRQILAAGGGALIGGVAAMAMPRVALAADTDQTIDLYPAARNTKYDAGRPVTAESITTNYNNFYEFGTQKDVNRSAQALRTRPWQIRIDGMVEKEMTVGIDDLVRKMKLEERIYRHRCVEAWSFVVPWTGFPLSALVAMAKPLGTAKYLQMETFNDPDMASGQRSFSPWPYVEGLTMAEATNDLAFLVTGAYGKPVGKVMGAPLRVHLPWKYGFKSVKSIVRFTFTDERPMTFWQQIQSDEYGFWANVNPEVPHPRWSQAMERDITTQNSIPTQIFNGYGEYVAGLYTGLKNEQLYR